jgi:hypothetical protein
MERLQNEVVTKAYAEQQKNKIFRKKESNRNICLTTTLAGAVLVVID